MKNFKILIAFFFALFILQNADAQTDTLKLELSKVSGSPGETVCVDVIVTNFKNIESLQFSLKFDATKLQYINYTKGTLNDLQNSSFFVLNGNQLNFTYDNIDGKTLPDGSVAFSLCFLIKGNAGDMDNLIFDTVGNVKPLYSVSLNEYTPIFPPSTPVKIVPVSLKPLRIAFDQGKAKTGDTVCIPIRVFDFNKIKNAEFDITWDNTKLKFEYLSAVNTQFAPNGTSSNFFSGPNVGPLSINWDASKILTNKTDLSLVDSTAIFTMCFKVLAPAGETTCIKVSAAKTPKVITASSNNQNVGMLSSDGCVRVPAVIPPVRISFCDNAIARKVRTGEEFCIDVKVADFDSIGGLSMSIAWDPLYFDSVKVKNLNPPNGINDVTWSFNPDNKNGFLGVLFESPSYTTLIDGSVIFQICLRARGPVGTTNGVSVGKIPVPIDVTSAASVGENIGLIVDGSCPIIIESAIKIVDTLIVQPNCKNPIGGKVEMTVAGGLAPYTYKWSPNAYNGTTRIAKDLPTGIFYCTITDATLPNPNILIAVFDLAGDLVKPTAIAKVTGALECKNNSFVTLDGAGSSTGQFYAYQWISEKGVIDGSDIGLTAKAISSTMYYLEVTDSRNGCKGRDTVSVAAAVGAPIADAGPNVQIPCILLSVPVSLDGCNSTPKPAASYAWGSPNGGKINSKFTECNPSVIGKGIYILTVTLASNGCKAYSKTEVISDSNTPIAIAEVLDSINCKNPSITLDGSNSSTGAGVSYLWLSIDGNPITNPINLKATVEKPGTYILKVTNSLNCSTADTVTVFDFSKDTVTANVISPARISCDGSPTVLDGSGSTSGADITYKWIVSPGNSGSIVKDATTTKPTINGAGKYLLTVKNKKSYCESIATVNVLQANIPQGVEAGIDTTLTCFTPEITLNADAPSSTDYDLKWTTKNGAIKSGATSKNPVITKTGTYVFTVTEKATKCRTIDSLVINENKDKPNAKIIGGKELTCGKDTITLNSSGSVGADVFEWFTKDGKFCSLPTLPDVCIYKEGTYILLATKVSNGCVDSATHTVKFIYPTKGNAGADTILCSDNKVTLNATISGNSTGLWTIIDGGVISDKTSNLAAVDSLKTGKNRFVWVLSAAGCPDFSIDTIEVFVEKNPILKDDVIAQRNNGQIINVPVTLNDDLKGTKSWKIDILEKPTYGTLSTSGSKGALRYEPSPCFAGIQNFSYKICSDACPTKCDTAKVKLNILEDPSSCKDIVIPNTITPNGDGKNDVFRIDAIEFQPERFKNAELIIFNRWGDVVYKSGRPYANNWGGTNSNGNELPEATYYYLLDLNLPDGVSYKGDITVLK